MNDLKPGITFRVSIKDGDETYLISDFWYQNKLINNQVAFECIYEPRFTLHYCSNYWYLGLNNGELNIWKKYIKDPEDCKITDNFKYLLNTDLLDLEYVNLTAEWIPCLDETKIKESSITNDKLINKLLVSYRISKQCFIEDFDFSQMNYKDSFDPGSMNPSGRDIVYPNGWWFTKNCFSYDEEEFNYNYLAGNKFELANKELLIKLGLKIDFTEEIDYKILSENRKSLVKYVFMIKNDLELGWEDDIADIEQEINEIDEKLECQKKTTEFLNIVENIIIWNFNGNQLFIIPYTSDTNKFSLIYNNRGIILGKLPHTLEKKNNIDVNDLEKWTTEDIYSWFKYQEIDLNINKLEEMNINGTSIKLLTESVLKNYFNLDKNIVKKATQCLNQLLGSYNLKNNEFVNKMENLLNNHKKIINDLELKLETTLKKDNKSDLEKSNELFKKVYYEEKDLRSKLERKYEILQQLLESIEKEYDLEHKQNLDNIKMLTGSLKSANEHILSKEYTLKNLEYKFEQHEIISKEKESYYISDVERKNILIDDLKSQINCLNKKNDEIKTQYGENLNLIESNKNLNMLATVASIYNFDSKLKVEEPSIEINCNKAINLTKQNTKKVGRILRNRTIYY